MPERTAAPAKKRDVLRLIVWPVLAVVVAGGVYEISVRRQAGTTAKAWRETLAAAPEDDPPRVSDLGGRTSGSPTTSQGPATEATREQTPLAVDTISYTWSGLLRKYVVRVHVGRGEDPEVEAIEGP